MAGVTVTPEAIVTILYGVAYTIWIGFIMVMLWVAYQLLRGRK